MYIGDNELNFIVNSEIILGFYDRMFHATMNTMAGEYDPTQKQITFVKATFFREILYIFAQGTLSSDA